MSDRTLGQLAASLYGSPINGGKLYTWDQIADAIIHEHEARRWRSIESAPKDGYILAWSPERRMAFQVIWSKHYDDWTIMCGDGVATMEFTLWTAIPAPPKEAEHGEV